MTTTDVTTTATTRDAAASRVQAAAQHLYEAEVALHIAHQSRVDAWIAAAAEKLHQAVVEHLVAIAQQGGTRP